MPAVYKLRVIQRRLGEPLARVVPESFLIAHILAEHLERLVPAMLLHLEQVGAL
jgi:hypothetical protein